MLIIKKNPYHKLEYFFYIKTSDKRMKLTFA